MSRIAFVAASRPGPAVLATQLKGLLRQDTSDGMPAMAHFLIALRRWICAQAMVYAI